MEPIQIHHLQDSTSDHEKLNTLQWNSAGNEIVYTFNVKKTGNYNIRPTMTMERKNSSHLKQ